MTKRHTRHSRQSVVRGDRRWVGFISEPGRQVGPGIQIAIPRLISVKPVSRRVRGGTTANSTSRRGTAAFWSTTRRRSTLVYTYRNQLFKGPNDLDFDAEGNLFFTDPWGTGPGPSAADRTGAVYQYSHDGVLRRVMDSGSFPNGIAVSPDNGVLAIGDCREGRVWYSAFITGPTMGCPQCSKDPLHLTFAGVKAGTYVPGNSCPDGIHYDAHGNLWAQLGGLGGIVEIDPRGLILGFVPIPNGDAATTNFAFGGPDDQYIYFEGANSGTFWRFKAPYPGLIGPGGVCLPAQP
jgi:gluconolactonase